MDQIKAGVRKLLAGVAKAVNNASRGKVTPNQITLAGLLLHIPVAALVALGYLQLAGVLLIVFGLFDVLDGELARLQKRTSAFGMFLDSVTDRVKEVLIYVGISAWLFYSTTSAGVILIMTGALGISMLISYLNAWGEAVLARTKTTSEHKMNQTLRGGLMGFDVRMTVIAAGLIFNRLDVAVFVIFILGSLTATQRLNSILSRLKDA